MNESNLTLFRRHEKSCDSGRPKEFRIYESMVEIRKGKTAVRDCSCGIYSEGALINGAMKLASELGIKLEASRQIGSLGALRRRQPTCPTLTHNRVRRRRWKPRQKPFLP